MFRGDNRALGQTMALAVACTHDLAHPRVWSEHLLLALAARPGEIANILARHGATPRALQGAALLCAPAGAGAAADQNVLATLGIDLDCLINISGAAILDRPARREPMVPLGAGRVRRRCSRMNPPLGLDAQAAYESSLRLALARREREYRPEHLALAPVTLDPGVEWLLITAGVASRALFADLAIAFPPPRRSPLLRAERRLGRRLRHRDIVQRYQGVTGRTAAAGPAVGALIVG